MAMTKDIGFVARNKNGKYIFVLDEGLTSKYLSHAKVYVSYSDWKSDIQKTDSFELKNFEILPVKMKLMTE